jgi:mono/diheme cytochrome c family protein
MKTHLFPSLSALLLALATAQAEPTLLQADRATQLQRGKYLVERVVICANCHTPRNWRGRFDADRSLMGSKLVFAPTSKSIPWSPVAPAIARLSGFASDEQAVKYFKTGVNAAGKESRPPMPQLRLDHDDALAVVAYLRSLKPGSLK